MMIITKKKSFFKGLECPSYQEKIRSTLKSLRELIRFFQPMANSAPKYWDWYENNNNGLRQSSTSTINNASQENFTYSALWTNK